MRFLALLAWLSLSFATAAIGAVASADAPTFYAELTRPAWAPPAWLFGPVWTALFTMMGVAAWLVWSRRAERPTRAALFLFVLQLVANGLWSWLFFAWHAGFWSFVDIVVLWLLIVATTVAFARVHRVAAVLLLPYLAWVTFAAALNVALWRANPGLLG